MTLRLLLVEHEESERAAVKRALAHADLDADVREANDSAAALALLSPEWDCVLLHYHLKGGNGSAVIDAARAPALRLPVVVLTAHGDPALAVEVMQHGASDCLSKAQLTPERLVQSVRQAVRLAQAERRERETAGAIARQAAQLAHLVEAGAQIHTAGSVDGVLSCVATAARELFGAAFAIVRTSVESETKWAVGRKATPGDDGLFAELSGLLPATDGVLRTDAPETARHPALRALAEAASRGGLPFVAWLTVPMKGRGGASVGALHLARADGALTESDASLLTELANTSAIAIENARLYREAKEATRARDAVLAIVSHDLRGPLNNVSLSASLLGEHLDDRGGDTERERMFIRRITSGVARMNRLIGDLIEVSKIESGILALTRRPEVAVTLLSDGLEGAAPLAEAKGCLLERGAIDEQIEILADRDRVLQVLANVLGNAVRLTAAGARITVSLAREAGFAVFAVRDEGPGMSPAHVARLFDRVWKAPDAAREGAGMGLFIARGIVEGHGGRFVIESPHGGGTTVSFWIPTT